jgi:hypothetical protein
MNTTNLASYWPLFALASGLLMLADYWLTLWAAQPALKAGTLYELNPWLRPAVAAQRWWYGPFLAAALGVIVMLCAIGSLVRTSEDAFLFYALCGGIIATRLHLVVLHLVNRLRSARQAAVPPASSGSTKLAEVRRLLSVPAAMLKLAAQQTVLAVLWTLTVQINRWPWLEPWLVGAAAGFLLMAAATLIWREAEMRRQRRAAAVMAPVERRR